MPLPIRISHDSAEPLYHQIAEQLRSLIVSGKLPPGTMLPSIRELAAETDCSVITVRRVYQELEGEGLVHTRQGTGTFVADVGAEQRIQFRLTVVRDTLTQALERIRMSGLTKEEIREAFEEALQLVFQDERGGRR